MDDSESNVQDSVSTTSSSRCLDDSSSDSEEEVQSQCSNARPLVHVLLAFTAGALTYYDNYLHKNPVHVRSFSGWAYLMSMINGRDIRNKQNMRMKGEVFLNLCKTLVDNYGLKPLKFVTVEEQVATFMMVVTTQEGNRQLQEMLQRSGFTISKSFHSVLLALTKMSMDWIRPFHDPALPHPYIRNNPKYWPHFKDCVGAIDGTHVDAKLKVKDQTPYRGRKGYTTQNCMVACDFDMYFTFVLPGWEGSAHDTRIFYDTIRDPNKRFPMPAQGKYYLVDAGYPNVDGFLAPYKGHPYHQPEFRRTRHYNNHNELFNHVHSSLRSRIECSFGVWKQKFQIFKHMQINIKFEDQVALVPATMAIYNFIRRHDRLDEDFVEAEAQCDLNNDNSSDERDFDDHGPEIQQADPTMNQVRNDICTSITFARLGVAVI